MPTLSLPDHSELYYLDENRSAGRVVLLLHGLGATSDSWALQFPALAAAGWRILAADTPGFGRSRAARPFRSIAAMAAFIPALLDHLGLSKVSLVGISIGGTQALQFSLDHPERVERLALVNTFARLDLTNPRVWPYYLKRLALVYARGLPAQGQAVAWRIFPDPGQEALRAELLRQILQAQPGVYRAAMLALARFNQQSRLETLKLPTLVVTGERDGTVPPAVQARLARALPGAQRVILSNAGHAASVERPAEFNRCLVDFLNHPVAA